MKILIPLISKKENNAEFLNQAIKGAKEVILLLIIDANAIPGIGFVAAEIGQGQELMQKIKEEIGRKRKTCNDLMEWGDTLTKVSNTALLQKADKIILAKQDNHFFKELLKNLKEKVEAEIEVISTTE